MPNHVPRNVRILTKGQLRDLIADTKAGCPDAILQAVAFVSFESFGLWHNRARANFCRHFKNHRPAPDLCEHMVDVICGRLISGKFYEQFWEQLSMAIRFDVGRMVETAKIAGDSDRDYIRRYGVRVLHAIDSIPETDGTG